MLPLSGVRVLDFSTLLPGPMATLLLAEAGAEVIKIERAQGEDMRRYEPRFGEDSVTFAVLNRGKHSLTLDLKAKAAMDQLRPLVESADVLVEQFRPGVMDRLSLGYAALKEINPKLIYCSITGFGQTGPKSPIAAHDLNYQADTGMLSLAAAPDGSPVVPPALVADIAGGSYPAVMNILLALRLRERTQVGCHIDISMTDCLFPFMFWATGTRARPQAGGELLTGGSPRYQVYRTSDGKFLAAAPLEDRFWSVFCDVIELPAVWRDDSKDAQGTKREVAALIATQTAAVWMERFRGKDACCNLVRNVGDTWQDEHYVERGLFTRSVTGAGADVLPASIVPIVDALRDPRLAVSYPRLRTTD